MLARLAPLLAGLLIASPALADAGDRARAERLFREGSEALEKGRNDEACTKLAESAALYRALGTEYNLGTCFEVTHRVASAKRAYLRAAAIAKQSGKEAIAKDAYARARKMDQAIPRLVVTIAGEVPGATLQCDGTAFVAGDVLELDPGSHLVKATAPGRAVHDERVELVEGKTRELVVTFEAAGPPPVAGVSAEAARPGSSSPVAPAAREGFDLATVTGIALGGAGVAALGVGFGFGLHARSERDDAGCADGRRCPDRASADRLAEAKSSADVATALIVAGGVLAAAGAVVGFVDPLEWRIPRRRASVTPIAGPGLAAVRLSLPW